MQTSNFLAKLLGPPLLVLGASLAFNRKSYTEMAKELVASRSLVDLAGTAALTAGLALLLNHNIWAADWHLIITLLGWVATLAGITRLLLPDTVQHLGRGVFASERPIAITGLVWIALGAILSYAGYRR